MPRPLTEHDVADFRGRLIAVAEGLFAERGPAAVTMRHLASELGVSPMTPYRYFRDKDHILAAVRAHGFNRFADAMEAAFESQDDAFTRASAVAEAYAQFAIQHPAAYRLMFELGRQGEGDDPELAAAARRARATLTGHAKGLVEGGMIEGDPVMIAHMLWASLHGALVLQMGGKLSAAIDPAQLRREVFLTLLRGLGLNHVSEI